MKLVKAAAILIGLISGSIMSAALIPIGDVDASGTGFGAVDTILTIQNNDSEVGCVGRNSAGEVLGTAGCASLGFLGGDERTSGSGNKTETYLIGGGLDFDALRIIFNINEAQDDGGNINLLNLQLSIYEPDGDQVFTSTAFSDPLFLTGYTGQGKSGVVFGLDPSDAALAEPFFVDGNRIGLNASVTGSSGGAESFRLAEALMTDPGDPGDPVPEPATILMLGGGFLALGALRRRRS